MTIENMIKYCEGMTPSEHQFASYLLTHKEEISTSTLQELINKTYISKSAIFRFCKKIGLDGFNELKVKIAKDLADEKNLSTTIDVNFPFDARDSQRMIAQKLLLLYESAITDTHNFINTQMLNRVISLLHNARIIDIYTHAHNINIAENFQDKMRSIGRMVNCSESFYEQRCMATISSKEHVALILSYSGKATFLPQIVETLYKKNVPIILIGRAGNQTFDNYIKYRLYISDKEHLRDRISQFSSHIAMQYMLDVIFSCIFNMDYEKNISYINEVIKILDDRNLDNI